MPKPSPVLGHDEQVRHPVVIDQLGLGDVADEAHEVADALGARQRLEAGPVVAVAGDRVGEVGKAGAQRGQGTDHPVVALIAVERARSG